MKFETLKNIIKWVGLSLVVICFVLITYLSLQHGIEAPFDFRNVDKIEHFIAYTGFSFSLTLLELGFSKRFFCGAKFKSLVSCGVLPVVIALFYGVFIEFVQPHFGRSFDVLDMVADFTGALFGALLCLLCVVFMCKILLNVETKQDG